MKLISTYKTDLSNTPWFNYKHPYFLSVIGLLKNSGKADFNTWLDGEIIKRIRKPICD